MDSFSPTDKLTLLEQNSSSWVVGLKSAHMFHGFVHIGLHVQIYDDKENGIYQFKKNLPSTCYCQKDNIEFEMLF
jgi:hypothetical protein